VTYPFPVDCKPLLDRNAIHVALDREAERFTGER
jgi:hypothetical protein